MIPETPARIRETLGALGRRPRKRLGQNFLADPNVRDAIVRDSGVGPSDLVLEIGPGLGTLTKGLLDAGARVLAAEIDEDLADFLEAEFVDRDGFRLVRGDAMKKGELAPALVRALAAERAEAGRLLLVANLPYAISTPLLTAVAADPEPPDGIVVMVQKEVADRMAGRPGTGEYGPLAVLLALRGRVRILRELSGRVFFPSAPVRSAVVEVIPRPVARRELEVGNRAARLAFLHRRKTLRRALSVAGIPMERVDAALRSAGTEPVSRPEVLSPEQFVSIGLSLFGETEAGAV